MREIKFRVWNTQEKEMIYDPPLILNGVDFIAEGEGSFSPSSEKPFPIGMVTGAKKPPSPHEEPPLSTAFLFPTTLDTVYLFPPRIEIMQYTGLKDKDGKEIYEGDIISDPNWWWGPGEVFLNLGECGPCKGESVMSYVCRGKGGSVSHNIWDGKDVEIIGNIYENPELLEKRDE